MTILIHLVNLGSQSNKVVLLLTANTEVIIAPKPHQAQGPAPSPMFSNSGLTTIQTIGTLPPKEPNISEVAVWQNTQIVRVLPWRILRTPYCEYTGPELTAYVSPYTFSQLRPSHKFVRNTATACFQTNFKRLSPPIHSSTTSLPNSPILHISKPEAVDKVDRVDGQQTSASRSMFVGWADGIPEKHIVFPALPDSIEEWDLIQ